VGAKRRGREGKSRGRERGRRLRVGEGRGRELLACLPSFENVPPPMSTNTPRWNRSVIWHQLPKK